MALRNRQKEVDLSLVEARSLLSYDREAGTLNWIRSPRRGVAVGPAGRINSEGYRTVRYRGHEYMACHLIWFLETGEWPEHGVDHRNRNRADDSWGNLRPATCTQNGQNKTLRKDNSTGIHGVGFDARRGLFYARIVVDGQSIYLGSGPDLAVIAAARRAAEIKHFGEFSPLYGGH